jgi:hypothetical protein
MPMDVCIICNARKMACGLCSATTQNVGAKNNQKETWTNQNDSISTVALLCAVVVLRQNMKKNVVHNSSNLCQTNLEQGL